MPSPPGSKKRVRDPAYRQAGVFRFRFLLHISHFSFPNFPFLIE